MTEKTEPLQKTLSGGLEKIRIERLAKTSNSLSSF
jgi:hypothetical protein